MDESTRTKIILAAIESVGPVGDDPASWQDAVAQSAARITAMTSERSAISKVVDSVANSKVFPATIQRLQLEKASNRVMVTLGTKPSTHHPDGVEVARTERLDNGGQALANTLKALKGHRVMLWVEVQETSASKKVRIVTHVEDLGPADDE